MIPHAEEEGSEDPHGSEARQFDPGKGRRLREAPHRGARRGGQPSDGDAGPDRAWPRGRRAGEEVEEEVNAVPRKTGPTVAPSSFLQRHHGNRGLRWHATATARERGSARGGATSCRSRSAAASARPPCWRTRPTTTAPSFA